MIRPPRLRPGDCIGIVDPCWVMEREKFETVAALLREKGYTVKPGKHLGTPEYGYAASPEHRAEDFNAMAADPEVKMILFGGGEVGNELLPLLDYDALRRCPKILSSYSDGTTLLNAVTSLTGLVTFYGQSPRTFFDLTPENDASFRSHLTQTEPPCHLAAQPWRVLRPGSPEGRLIGGYLMNFALMQNTPYLQTDPGVPCLLFLEDSISFFQPPAIAKFLAHIGQSGLMNRVSGLLWGHYDTQPQPMLDEVLTRFADTWGIPCARCEDFGHGRENRILPIGVRAKMDTAASRLIFAESGVC